MFAELICDSQAWGGAWSPAETASDKQLYSRKHISAISFDLILGNSLGLLVTHGGCSQHVAW